MLSQVVYYPLSEFDGKMKTKDWSKLPHFPAPKSDGKGETKWVNPETFFDELPAVMKQVPPLPGEEALYNWIGSVLEAAAKDPQIKQTLKETAVAAERELIDPFFQWRNNGRPAGNGWNSPVNNAQWGTDYLNRTATAKSNMYDNRPQETKYIYTDNDSQGKQLNGQNTYTITFAKGQVPPVKGFWSLTLYNDVHMFNPNPLKRYSLGTKNKTLKYNADGSLTLYAGAKSPGKDKESNWLPAPERDVLALHPRLLARQGHPRRHVAAAGDRDGEVNKPIERRRDMNMKTTHTTEPPRRRARWRAGDERPCTRRPSLRRPTSINSPTSRSRKAGPRRRPRRHSATNCSSNGRRRPTSGRCR